MEDLLYELMAIVKQTAPELWRIALRQVAAEVVGQLVIFVFLATVGVFLLVYGVRNWRDPHADFEDDNVAPPVLVGFAFLAGGLVPLMLALMRIVSPEYYAIKVLMGLVK